ncbi:type II toxin-antitoxin system death-on-curing family toxin [Pontixanthobacter aestiaquae]|uniref:Type II toxin-antitoxin system death-on-curing family toxin n=1 Tax=Pontixanthobacter aestiaquae TaxID=1509367 RepID=A0A844Z917_9SPHN|nr:type II toxin-antitoxin system death-on-curing family toxin [Pontixanthobacter aestiaquae]MDN3645015.1 type II toxin-antitoxin system death-on-curing family toxin [Pontixanthobacter aestiaquae]MXO83984.1 type II toxin-antitoxin system death-on-curing family toxin [Pontixanthobacter aestiaquae]
MTADLIVEFNELAVTETGEPHLLNNPDALDSALARPMHYWNYGERDVVVLAVSLLVGIGQNHPFIQGNKRCAFAAADYFLYLNGYELVVPDTNDLADLICDTITSEIGEQRLVEVLWDYIEPA